MGFFRKPKKETAIVTKCTKCEKREATGEDGLCDSCRFEKVLDSMPKP